VLDLELLVFDDVFDDIMERVREREKRRGEERRKRRSVNNRRKSGFLAGQDLSEFRSYCSRVLKSSLFLISVN